MEVAKETALALVESGIHEAALKFGTEIAHADRFLFTAGQSVKAAGKEFSRIVDAQTETMGEQFAAVAEIFAETEKMRKAAKKAAKKAKQTEEESGEAA